MKYLLGTLTLLLALSGGVAGQGTPGQVLLTIGGTPITRTEFERIYLKNQQMVVGAEKPSLEEYLELFINYKLKVAEATAEGLHETQEFRIEMSGYRQQLAEPFLTDREFMQQMIDEAYRRMQYEVNASHILLNLGPEAPPADTLRVFNKMMRIRDRILAGEPFEAVARATSDDHSVAQNGGNLGYFTVFQMFYPFEAAAYNTPVGQVSLPVRTRLGYHIVKVHNRRPFSGSMKVAHILSRLPNNPTPEQAEQAQRRIDSLHRVLVQRPEAFAALAQSYSDDRRSAAQGGELEWFHAGQMLQEIFDAAFALERNGQISQPVRTRLGWHIVKRIDKRGLGPLEQELPRIRAQFARDGRTIVGLARFIESMKAKHGFSVDPAAKAELTRAIDSTFFSRSWTLPPLATDRPLFTFAGRQYPMALVTDYLVTNHRHMQNAPLERIVPVTLSHIVENTVKEFEIQRLERENKDFYYLLREYHDGILLFEISNRNVWSKASNDSVALAAFYQQHIDHYRWDSRAYATIYTAPTEAPLRRIARLISSRRGASLTPQAVMARLALDTVQVAYQSFAGSPQDPQLAGHQEWRRGVSPIASAQDGFRLTHYLRTTTNEAIPLESIRGQVIADYQDYLERRWLEELRQRFPVVVNQDVFADIKAQLQ